MKNLLKVFNRNDIISLKYRLQFCLAQLFTLNSYCASLAENEEEKEYIDITIKYLTAESLYLELLLTDFSNIPYKPSLN